MEGLAEKEKLSDIREEEIQRRLKQLNRPAVKSFHLPNGDIIDCVRFIDQLAFDNPLLKDHKIQMRPSSIPTFAPPSTVAPKEGQSSRESSLATVGSVFWPYKCEKCPENTFPIKRLTREDLLRIDGCYKKTAPFIPMTR